MNPSILRITQLSISGLCLCLSIAVLGTAGHSLQVYRSQYLTNPWWLPLWNAHFNVHGTDTLIGAAATALVLNLVFIGCCLFPKLKLSHRPTLRALLTLATASSTCIITFVVIIYVHMLNAHSPHRETIQTWTCKFKNKPSTSITGTSTTTTSTTHTASIPRDISNADFGSLCAESKFALYATLVVFLLQGSMLVVAVVGWCVDKRAARRDAKVRELGCVEMQPGVGQAGGHVFDRKLTTTSIGVRAVAGGY